MCVETRGHEERTCDAIWLSLQISAQNKNNVECRCVLEHSILHRHQQRMKFHINTVPFTWYILFFLIIAGEIKIRIFYDGVR